MPAASASCRLRVFHFLIIGLLLALMLGACGGGEEPVALPAELEAGRAVYVRLCAVCHGPQGEGAVGPALASVNETFDSCDDQMRWITLGSEQWKQQVGPTLGGREITGVMPPFDQVLTPAEIAQVAAFQRHAFAGELEDEALAACGLVPSA